MTLKKLPVVRAGGDQAAQPWPSTDRGMHLMFRTTRGGTRLSLNTLASRAGLTKRAVQQIQNGERGMSLDVGLRVARALDRSPWWVLEYSKRAQARRRGR